jgi:adenylate cyclase
VILRPRSFRAKLLLLFVLVVTAAQFATWFLVSRYHDRQARQLIDEELQQAALTFARLVEYRNFLLTAGAQTAARDHPIKQLLIGDDVVTLASALESVRLTNRGDLVSAVAPDAKLLASTSRAAPAEGLFARLIALAEAETGANPTARSFGYFGGELYSVVIAPVQAPEIIAWLAVGFRIDRTFAAELKTLTGIDLTFFDSAGGVLASTLPAATVRDLAAALPSLAGLAGSCACLLGGETALVTTRRLVTGDRQSATLALQYSLDAKLKPARETENLMLLVATGSLALAVFLSLGFARQLTRPIAELVGQTRRIARGDYTVRSTAYRDDELGRLAQAFDEMSLGLAERDRVRDLLDKNVSPEVAAQLLRDGATLGGEEREVTILFADLRGFTTLSEQLPPRDLLTLLNRYLDRMSAAIESHGGVIDKFIGDAIMALFGAPVAQGDAADRAIAAALAMEAALAALNAELAAEGRPPLALGVGINTARVVAGNIGSQRRLNYSVIGDGVNVAARLQALTRTAEYRTNVIVSAATRRAAKAPGATRPLGTVAVKGRAEPVEIFAVDRPA